MVVELHPNINEFELSKRCEMKLLFLEIYLRKLKQSLAFKYIFFLGSRFVNGARINSRSLQNLTWGPEHLKGLLR